MTPAPSVLVVAFTCQPSLGSEYEVGWQWSQHAPPDYAVTVVTRRACFAAIPGPVTYADGTAEKRVGHVRYVAIDLPFADRVLRGRRWMRSHYFLWQLGVLRHVLSHRSAYDVIHHVCFVAVWMPAFAAASGRHVVWGPVGTSMPLPSWSTETGPVASRARAWLRRLVTVETTRKNPLVHWCQRRATRMVAINERVRSLVHPSHRHKVEVRPAIGIDRDWLASAPPPLEARQRTALYVGRYFDSKLPDVAFEAGARIVASDPTAEFVMIGEGLAERLPAPRTRRTRILGPMTRNEVRAHFDTARVFVFPSFEGSGFVTLEALARGVPVVCFEGTGAAELAGPEAGIVCSAGRSREEAVAAITRATLALLDDDERWRACSAAARRRAASFEWSTLTPFLSRIYSEARGATA